SQYVAGWATHYSYNANGLSADIAVGTNGAYPYVLVTPTQGDMLSGTVDLKSILWFLIQQGVLTGKEYIDGWEMGAEPTSGSGSLTINSIGYDWNGTNAGTGWAFRSTTRPGRQLRSIPTQRQSR